MTWKTYKGSQKMKSRRSQIWETSFIYNSGKIWTIIRKSCVLFSNMKYVCIIFNSAIPLLGIYTVEKYTICLVFPNSWKQVKHSSTVLKKTGIFINQFTAMKMNKLYVITWMNLTNNIGSQRSKNQKTE